MTYLSDDTKDTLLTARAETLLRAALGPEAQFRDGQLAAVQALVQERRRLLVVQRTGWGKSLVYFLATRLLRDAGAGPTLLVSPLLALMRNQLAAASRLGVRARTLNSSNERDWPHIEAELLADEADLLLVSPERLANDGFRERVLSRVAERVGLLVVDEAHCISDWGHDFRPDYRRTRLLLQAMPAGVPILATTATANDRVVADIAAQLGDLGVVRGPLTRDSLRLQALSLPSQAERLAWLAAFVPACAGSGVVYTRTVRDAERVAAWLRERGVDARAYFGALEHEARVELEDALLQNRLKVLVATSALGMGFDKPDLAFVVHYQRPGSATEYYQQVGRAGRNLESALGVMLSGAEDDEITEHFIRTAFPPEAHTEAVLAALGASDEGLNVTELERALNLSRGKLEKALKILAVTTPSPVAREGGVWYRTPVPYRHDREKVAALAALRRSEQVELKRYLAHDGCLMAFLQTALDDPAAGACGRCAVCVGEPLVPAAPPEALVAAANRFLRRSDEPLEPRVRFPAAELSPSGTVTLPGPLRTEPGRALCRWGDGGWGRAVQRGKFRDGSFSDELVRAAAELVGRWHPDPCPTWLTAVPSRRNPELVTSFAERLADVLGLPFVACLEKACDTRPQKEMHNTYKQVANLNGAFRVAPGFLAGEPVLLVDDMVDSRWTFTVLGALLRASGSGPVYPLALAVTTGS